MMIASSLVRRLTVMAAAAVTFVLLYETTMLDSRYAARQMELREDAVVPAPGARLQFAATAYCKGSVTASGVAVVTGIAAADPTLLAVGSVVQIETSDPKYNGIYAIMDTGPRVQGRKIDIYMWSCYEALAFGVQDVTVTVLRLGWNPSNTTPALMDFLFRREPTETPLLPSQPLHPADLGDLLPAPAPSPLPR